MTESLRITEIETALRSRNLAALKVALKDVEPHHVAALLDEMGDEDRAVVFRMLGHDQAAEAFEYLEPENQESLIKALGTDRVASILNDMAADDRTALLEELPAEVTRQILQALSPEERRRALTLLGYPEDSVGRLMTPDYVRIKKEWTVSRALAHIRKYGRDSETLNVIFVVDERGRLVDDVRIRFLLLNDPEATVADILDGMFVALSAWDDQESAVEKFRDTDRTALPVIDRDGVLLGIVTVDDVLDVVEEEATEDIQKIGAVAALDEPYIDTRLTDMIRKRAGWLVLLFFGQMLTANAIKYFEGEIARALVLVVFLPLIIASGGNSGSQAATLVIRAMSLGEDTLEDWWRVMRREILSGLALGAIVGAIGFARVAVDRYALGHYGAAWPWLATTLAVSLVLVVMWGTIVGSMLPFALRRIGADPAASSTPFVSTLVDVTGLVIYFSVAAVVLRGSLL